MQSFSGLLGEIARILRPGGLLLSGEWSHSIFVESDEDLHRVSPRLSEFFQLINPFMHAYSVEPVIAQFLRGDERFVGVEENEHNVPLDDSPRGERMKLAVIEYGESLRPFLLDSGISDERINVLLRNMQNELETTHGLFLRYHTLHCRRA